MAPALTEPLKLNKKPVTTTSTNNSNSNTSYTTSTNVTTNGKNKLNPKSIIITQITNSTTTNTRIPPTSLSPLATATGSSKPSTPSSSSTNNNKDNNNVNLQLWKSQRSSSSSGSSLTTTTTATLSSSSSLSRVTRCKDNIQQQQKYKENKQTYTIASTNQSNRPAATITTTTKRKSKDNQNNKSNNEQMGLSTTTQALNCNNNNNHSNHSDKEQLKSANSEKERAQQQFQAEAALEEVSTVNKESHLKDHTKKDTKSGHSVVVVGGVESIKTATSAPTARTTETTEEVSMESLATKGEDAAKQQEQQDKQQPKKEVKAANTTKTKTDEVKVKDDKKGPPTREDPKEKQLEIKPKENKELERKQASSVTETSRRTRSKDYEENKGRKTKQLEEEGEIKKEKHSKEEKLKKEETKKENVQKKDKEKVNLKSGANGSGFSHKQREQSPGEETTTKTTITPSTSNTITEFTTPTIDEAELLLNVTSNNNNNRPHKSSGDGQNSPSNQVDEQPPLMNTTTSSEELVDNIEERLSQLDGTAITPSEPTAEDGGTLADPVEMLLVPATPPKTPVRQLHVEGQATGSQQSLEDEEKRRAEIQKLQQELLMTPPTPLAQLSQQQTPSTLNAPLLGTPPTTTNLSTGMSPGGGVGTVIMPPPPAGGEPPPGGDIADQELEEVLKALKNYDGNMVAGDVCDLNVLFSEVYTTLNCEVEGGASGSAGASGGVTAPGASLGGSVSNLTIPAPDTSPLHPSYNPVKESLQEIEKKQQLMTRKVDFLLRRYRKMQARYICKHSSEEIAGLLEMSGRMATRQARRARMEAADGSLVVLDDEEDCGVATTILTGRPPVNYWDNERKRPLAMAQMTQLLRKLEQAANSHEICTQPSTRSKHHTSYITTTAGMLGGAGGSPSQPSKKGRKPAALVAQMNKEIGAAAPTGTKSLAPVVKGALALNSRNKNYIVVPTFDQNMVDEMSHVSGLLHSELRDIQKALDSDATESSSGGESADEMVAYNNVQQLPKPIAQRAAYRYSRDRAAIAARWSWLLLQIADLEIKIRQHNEQYQDTIKAKAPVVSEYEVTDKMVAADATVGGQLSAATTTSSVNGYKAVNKAIGGDDCNEEGSLPGSCRTRGFVPSMFRKRKLVQTTSLHTISKKAARPSTIKCGCQFPLSPCPLCTGRPDPTAPRDLPDTMMFTDRVALLDSGYHPVLSLPPEDISTAIQIEAIAKQSEWQQRVARAQSKSIAKSVWKADREAGGTAGRRHGSGGNDALKRKYIKRKDRLAATKSTVPAPGTVPETGATSKTTPGGAPQAQGEGLPTNFGGNAAPPWMKNRQTGTPMEQQQHQQQQNYDPYNPNQAHLSLISSSSNKNLFSSTPRYQHHSHYRRNNSHYHQLYNTASSQQQSFNNGEYQHHPSCTTSFNNIDNCWDSYSNSTRSRTSSPTHGGGVGGSSNYYQRYQRNKTAYDIDNIVIPYSVAAATRVEIIPYKEIPTPKWRIIDEDNDNSDSPNETEEEWKKKKQSLTEVLQQNCASTEANPECPGDMEKSQTPLADATNTETNKEIKINGSKVQKICSPSKDTKGQQEGADSETDDAEEEREEGKEPKVKRIKLDVVKAQDSKFTQKTSSEDSGELVPPGEENLSDEYMSLRHERALADERRKFQTFMKFPWSTRSRANRRMGSKTESISGQNTPDPASPAPQTPSGGGGDQESIPSPLPPLTPQNPLDTINETAGSSNNEGAAGTATKGSLANNNMHSKQRKRTTSAKRMYEQERRSASPEQREFVPPYEPLKFPLSEETFNTLLEVMPPIYHRQRKESVDSSRTISVKSEINDYMHVTGDGINGSGRPSWLEFQEPSTSRSALLGQLQASSTPTAMLPLQATTNGNVGSVINTMDLDGDTEDDDAAAMADNDDDDLNDYHPKHHLATGDDDDEDMMDNVYASNDMMPYSSEVYDSYVGGPRRGVRGHGHGRLAGGDRGVGDSDLSDYDPFQDEDPNDPEWKGEAKTERGDRTRRKL